MYFENFSTIFEILFVDEGGGHQIKGERCDKYTTINELESLRSVNIRGSRFEYRYVIFYALSSAVRLGELTDFGNTVLECSVHWWIVTNSMSWWLKMFALQSLIQKDYWLRQLLSTVIWRFGKCDKIEWISWYLIQFDINNITFYVRRQRLYKVIDILPCFTQRHTNCSDHYRRDEIWQDLILNSDRTGDPHPFYCNYFHEGVFFELRQFDSALRSQAV